MRARPFAWLAALALLAAPPALAQSLGFSRGGDAPIEIEADDGIEWRRAEQYYVARGNARARQGGVVVEADALVAHYRASPGGTNEIYRIEADGNVRILSADEIALADSAVYDVVGGVLVLTGEQVRLETPEDIVTARDSLEYYEMRKLAVARGDAVATRGDRRVRADVLIGHFGDAAAGDTASRLERMEAVGNVVIRTPTDTTRARRGDYDLASGLVTLSGDVRITRGDNQLNGEQAEVNLQTGVSRLLGSAAGSGRPKALILPRATRRPNGGETR